MQEPGKTEPKPAESIEDLKKFFASKHKRRSRRNQRLLLPYTNDKIKFHSAYNGEKSVPQFGEKLLWSDQKTLNIAVSEAPDLVLSVFKNLNDRKLANWCITFTRGIGPLPRTNNIKLGEYLSQRFARIDVNLTLINNKLAFSLNDPIRIKELSQIFPLSYKHHFGTHEDYASIFDKTRLELIEVLRTHNILGPSSNSSGLLQAENLKNIKAQQSIIAKKLSILLYSYLFDIERQNIKLTNLYDFLCLLVICQKLNISAKERLFELLLARPKNILSSLILKLILPKVSPQPDLPQKVIEILDSDFEVSNIIIQTQALINYCTSAFLLSLEDETQYTVLLKNITELLQAPGKDFFIYKMTIKLIKSEQITAALINIIKSHFDIIYENSPDPQLLNTIGTLFFYFKNSKHQDEFFHDPQNIERANLFYLYFHNYNKYRAIKLMQHRSVHLSLRTWNLKNNPLNPTLGVIYETAQKDLEIAQYFIDCRFNLQCTPAVASLQKIMELGIQEHYLTENLPIKIRQKNLQFILSNQHRFEYKHVLSCSNLDQLARLLNITHINSALTKQLVLLLLSNSRLTPLFHQFLGVTFHLDAPILVSPEVKMAISIIRDFLNQDSGICLKLFKSNFGKALPARQLASLAALDLSGTVARKIFHFNPVKMWFIQTFGIAVNNYPSYIFLNAGAHSFARIVQSALQNLENENKQILINTLFSKKSFSFNHYRQKLTAEHIFELARLEDELINDFINDDDILLDILITYVHQNFNIEPANSVELIFSKIPKNPQSSTKNNSPNWGLRSSSELLANARQTMINCSKFEQTQRFAQPDPENYTFTRQ